MNSLTLDLDNAKQLRCFRCLDLPPLSKNKSKNQKQKESPEPMNHQPTTFDAWKAFIINDFLVVI